MAYILAIQLGPWQDLGNGGIDTGYRPVLSVEGILSSIQTTTAYGNNLFQNASSFDIGSLNCITLFNKFLAQFTDKPRTWGELDAVPPNPFLYSSRVFVQAPPPPDPPVATSLLTLLGSGYDPMKGWWCRFKGNYGLEFGLFKDFPTITGGPADYGIKIN